MIVYTFKEELRIIIYLLAFGIFIVCNYDMLILIKTKSKINNLIIKTIYSVFIILMSYFFIYRLQEGYLPQYGILIVVIGTLVYILLLRNAFMKILNNINKMKNKILVTIGKIIKPLLIFKTTIFLLKQKIKKFNIKMLYKKKEL